MIKSLGLLFVLAVSVTANSLEIELEYSLDDWTTTSPLGAIQLNEAYDGNYTGTFVSTAGGSQLAQALQKSSTHIYRIKAKSGTQQFLTYTEPCLILRSQLVHLFWVAIDQDTKKINSITVFPDTMFNKGTLEECAVPGGNKEIQGVVHVRGTAALPVPDTQTFLDRIEKEKRGRQHGAAEDNRSFLSKYWMYIVPVVIFMAVSSAMNPEGQEGAAAQ